MIDYSDDPVRRVLRVLCAVGVAIDLGIVAWAVLAAFG